MLFPLRSATVHGELQLDSAEIVRFALYVFNEDAETMHKAFRVHIEHNCGVPQQRILVLSNKRAYIVARRSSSTEDEEKTYKTVHFVDYSDVDFVTVSAFIKRLYDFR